MNDEAATSATAKTGIRRILQNTAWLLGGKTFGGILSLFYLAIVTRTLGVEGFGQFAMIVGTAQAIAMFVTFDTWQVVIRYAAGLDRKGEGEGAFGRLIGLCALFDIGGALVGVALAVAVTQGFAPMLGWSDAVAVQALAFVAVMLLSVKSTATGVLRVENRYDLSTYAESVIPFVRMLGAAVVLQMGGGLFGFLIAWAAAEAVHAIVYNILAWRQARGALRWRYLKDARAAWAAHPGIGGFLGILNAQVTLNNGAQNIGLLVIGLFVSPAAAGLYRIASQLSGAMAKISTLLSRAIFAEVNWAREEGGKAAMRDLYGRANRMLYISGAVVMAVIVLTGKPILTVMSGPEFAAAYPIMVLLGLAAVINLIGAMNEPTLLSGEGAKTALILQAVATAMYAGLMAVLMPFYGAMGAAAAMVGFAIVRQVLLNRAAKAHLLGD